MNKARINMKLHPLLEPCNLTMLMMKISSKYDNSSNANVRSSLVSAAFLATQFYYLIKIHESNYDHNISTCQFNTE